MVTFDIDTKGVEGFKFLNPLGVVLARSVDGHDEDIFNCVFGLVEMPSDWFVTFVFGIPTVFKESGL